MSPVLQGRFLATGSPGKFQEMYFCREMSRAIKLNQMSSSFFTDNTRKCSQHYPESKKDDFMVNIHAPKPRSEHVHFGKKFNKQKYPITQNTLTKHAGCLRFCFIICYNWEASQVVWKNVKCLITRLLKVSLKFQTYHGSIRKSPEKSSYL